MTGLSCGSRGGLCGFMGVSLWLTGEAWCVHFILRKMFQKMFQNYLVKHVAFQMKRIMGRNVR